MRREVSRPLGTGNRASRAGVVHERTESAVRVDAERMAGTLCRLGDGYQPRLVRLFFCCLPSRPGSLTVGSQLCAVGLRHRFVSTNLGLV